MNLNDKKYHNSTPMGIHRLMAEPYDDREIFTSVSDLISYCENGACYDGQRVVCINGYNEDRYLTNAQEFIIKKYISEFNEDKSPKSYSYKPIIKLNNTELRWIQRDSNYYLQVYYYNGYISPGAMNREAYINNYHKDTLFFNDPGGFSIYEFINIFADEMENEKIKSYVIFKHTNANIPGDNVSKELDLLFPNPIENNLEIDILKYNNSNNDIKSTDDTTGNNYPYWISLFGNNIIKYKGANNYMYYISNTNYNVILEIYIKANIYHDILFNKR